MLNPLNSDAVEAVSGTVYEMGRGNKAKKKRWRRDVMTRERERGCKVTTVKDLPSWCMKRILHNPRNVPADV